MGDSPGHVEWPGQWSLFNAGCLQQSRQCRRCLQIIMAKFRQALQYKPGANRSILSRSLVHAASQYGGFSEVPRHHPQPRWCLVCLVLAGRPVDAEFGQSSRSAQLWAFPMQHEKGNFKSNFGQRRMAAAECILLFLNWLISSFLLLRLILRKIYAHHELISTPFFPHFFCRGRPNFARIQKCAIFGTSPEWDTCALVRIVLPITPGRATPESQIVLPMMKSSQPIIF